MSATSEVRMESPRLLTYQQAGDVLGLSDRTVWGLVAAGRLPSVRIGRAVRIDPADLDRFVERAKVTA